MKLPQYDFLSIFLRRRGWWGALTEMLVNLASRCARNSDVKLHKDVEKT